jgi:DamX protein
MEDNDTLTYRIKRTAPAKSVEQSLISQERKQKLDLVLHLLANLSKTLLVCGPQGIGKTTLLQKVQEKAAKSWLCCKVQSHAELSFEGILRQISSSINADRSQNDLPLTVTLGQLAARNQKLIVLLDDAGDLVPGLLTSLVQYAAANPVIRLVFALTHDELYVKNQTDSIIDECHLIELPPLSSKQSFEFLQYLATQTGSSASISEASAERIYRKTHGIPGRIITELPEFPKAKTEINPLYPLLAAVAILIAIALGLQWHSTHKSAQEPVPPPSASLPPTVEKKPAISVAELPQATALASGQTNVMKTTPALPAASIDAGSLLTAKPSPLDLPGIPETAVTSSPMAQLNSFESAKEPASAASTKALSSAPITAINVPPAPPIHSETEQKQPSGASARTDETANNSGADWVKAQPAESYTLQVMVLTKEDAIQAIIQRYPELEPELTYIKTAPIRGREKYLLLYGSFSTKKAALAAKKSLPTEFQHAYPRQFAAVTQ